MSEVAIRELRGEEMLEAMYRMDAYAFHPSPPLTDKEEWTGFVRPRQGFTYFALFEEDVPVSGAADTKMSLQVRDTLFNAGGIWGVVTGPAARRKGYCRRVMGQLLQAVREKGAVLSCLCPFRESFYERLGYVTYPATRIAKFKTSTLLPLVNTDLAGKIERLLIGDGYDRYRDYLRELQTHGMALFTYGNP